MPVAVALVWATQVLARVRVDARWDTRTQRLHVSVTRQRARYAPGTHDDAQGASRAFSRRVADVPLAGEIRDAASELETTSVWSPEPSLVDAKDDASNTSETMQRDGSQTEACSSAFLLRAQTRREAELRNALRAREKHSRAAASPPDAHADAGDDRTTPPVPSEPGLLGSWARLRDRVVREFVTDLWYAPITPDAQFPHAVSRVLDVAFAELAHRARRANLAELLLETAPVIVAENLERFRSAREVVGGVDAYVRRTPREADAAMAPTLWPRELFGDASLEEIRPLSRALSKGGEVFSRAPSSASGVAEAEAEDADPSPLLAAFEKHASRVLSARCVAVADALLRETALSSERAPDPLLRPLARELLVGCLLRPLLGFFSPAWAHRGLAALLAAEDDIAAARGGEAREGGGAAERAPSASPEKTPRSDPEIETGEATRLASNGSAARVVLAARVAEAHIAGKGASAYAVYAVRVRARTRASGDAAETELEWVVPRRFRNFEALHRRCEKEAAGESAPAAAETAPSRERADVRAFEHREAGVLGSDAETAPERVSEDASALRDESSAGVAFAPLPALPKKRFVINSLDGAFVEARRALLDQYLVALTSCPARASRSAATRAFLDPATVAGPFAPEPERDRGALASGFGPFAASATPSGAHEGASTTDARGGATNGDGAGDGDGPAAAASTARRGARRPPIVPERADALRLGTSVATSHRAVASPAPDSETIPWPRHRRHASSGAIPSRARAAFESDGEEAEKEGAPAPTRAARRSFPDLASAPATFAAGEARASSARAPDTPEITAVDSLARGGLLRLFESVFHLRAKGVVRRTIVAAARQTLEFFVGAAVEDLAAAKLRALRSPETVKAAVDLIERTLWPGGVWHGAAQARARASDGPVPAESGDAETAGTPRSARTEEERVRLKVRDALLASWSRGPLYNLVGARNCTRAGLDVLGAARSELLCARVGLEATLAALDAAFPESAVRGETATRP